MAKGETIVLNATVRETRGSAAAQKLRDQGLVPAVIYGHKMATVSINLSEVEFSSALRSGARMVDIKTGPLQEKTLIKEVQYNPISLRLLHADFARVALDEKVTVSVPIITTGTPKAATSGGVMDLVLKDIEVECLVAQIPSEIKIRVNDMEIGASVLVRDLEMPAGVVPASDVDPQATVLIIHAPREEEAAEEAAPEVALPAAAEAAEPEIIGEKERLERAEAKSEEKDREKKE